jgi:hypothetical protein
MPAAPVSPARPFLRAGGWARRLAACTAVCLGVCCPALAAAAAPFTPAADGQVLERVPARALDAAARERAALRQALQREPRDLDAATRLARLHLEAAIASGDPRHAGQAQAALAAWWDEPAPPPAVRVLRAVLLQYEHRFEAALADLAAATAADPADAEAWAWQAAIRMVRADYADARAACAGLAPLASPLVARACSAQVDAATGSAAAATAALRQALAEDREADPAQRLWVLTRLAETEERLGRFDAAEAAFKDALAEIARLGRDDVYLLAAWSDFLLDRGRAAEVMALTEAPPRRRADVLLLRRALAAAALKHPARDTLAAELAARFAAAAQRGDTTHQKEQARALLGLRGDDGAVRAEALHLAQQNFAVQREPADARLLLEAALAQRDRAAAAPALQWLAASKIESRVLADLAARIGALP